MVRQSLTTGNGAFGGIGFSTIDDSNNSGQYDAGRIAVVNEQGTAVLSATSMAFYTQSGYVSNTNASTERGRFNSVGGFNVGNTQNTFGAGVFVGANGSRLQSYQNVNVAQNTATNITPSGALAGDGCYLVQVTARGLGNSNNNRTKLYLVLFRAVSFSGSSITQIADVFPDTGTGGEITTLTTTLTFYSNADPCITVTAASRSGGSNTAVYVSIMGY
jgi:hypothetical protein